MSLRFSVPRLARAAVVGIGLLTIAVTGAASAQPAGDGGGHAQAGQAPGAHANGKTTTAAGVLGAPTGYPMLGIDVSSHDHGTYPIDWGGVAASGVRFSYVKATEGQFYVNPYFHADNVGSKAAGLLTGAYAFGRPDLGDPVGQANYFIDHAEWVNDSRTLIPMLDMEWAYSSLGLNACYNLTPAQIVTWTHGFIDQVKVRTGRTMVIYTGTGWWNPCTGNDTSFASSPLDLASWGSTPPTSLPSGWSAFTIWQYASGVTTEAGNYDKNAFNGDYAALTRLAGDVPADGPPIELRANANNRYVSADGGGKSPLIANRDAIGAWEQYDVVDAGNGDVALRSHSNGLYVTADSAGNAPLIANRPSIGAWERFTVVNNADGTMSLFANINGKYVTADNAGNSPLIANRDSIGAWEKFTKVPVPAVVSFRANINSRFVSADNAGQAPLIANRATAGIWEQYDVVDLGGGDVALRAHANNLYVTAESGGNAPLIANRTAVGAWERFRLVKNGDDGSVSLLAGANGKYVSADSAGAAALIANRTAIGAWERFTSV
jgi:GH25 family lysozyme M1 (1,4-beta-N-acetylmuramidase)